MFERFTDRARRVLVLAQEEARLLNHGFIGTEHILLGLIHEGEGVAAKVLEELEISLEDVRRRVEEIIGLSGAAPTGSPPFTPRAKKVLELSFREALSLGHNYIGTEHILLGLLREGEGVAAQILMSLGADLGHVRREVIQLLSGSEGREATEAGLHSGELVACSFCGECPPESGQLVSGGRGAYICEHCIERWHHAFSEDAGARSEVSRQPVITGRVPVDAEAARAAIALAFGHALILSEDRRTVPTVEGGELLGPCLKEAQVRHAALRRKDDDVTIDHIEFIDEEQASLMFAISLEGISSEPRRGHAVMVDSSWRMARETFCELMSLVGVECPPPTR